MKHTSVKVIAASGILLAGINACDSSSGQSDQKPNIVFILADDLGYMDICSYASQITGSKISEMFYETPNLDRLVANSIAFSQAYACPLCAPTRSSLLTGKYASRLGFTTAVPPRRTYYNESLTPPDGYYIHDVIYHGDDIPIPQAWINATTNTAIPRGYDIDGGWRETVLTDVMQEYDAAFIGKWHLGGVGAEGYSPKDLGFEGLAWFDAGGSTYFDWHHHWNANRKNGYPNIPQEKLMLGYAGEHSEHEYLTDDLTEKAVQYLKRQSANPDKPFFLYLCHFAVHTPIEAPESDVAYFEARETIGWNGHYDATYAAMIKRLDDGIGRIMDVLKETGLENNTLIVFMSDNGGWSWQMPSRDVPITVNAPLKGGKAHVFEGGIRVPLMFSWKGRIKPGQWSDVPVDANDMFPTLLQVAGYNTYGMDIDGESLVSLFSDPTNKKNGYSRDTFFWHYPFNVIVDNPDDGFPLTPHSAIRKGDHKLIFDWQGRLKLYNIREDISETTNLMRQQPELTRGLFAELINFLESNVEKRYWPVRNPDYYPDQEVRDVAFVDLYQAYKEGKDIVELANF